ncbi:DUF1572 domain-containing protein [Winogradskyella sp. PE311]|uniref:DUF1572 domain-containing protein n=1 Tax=Winogradskyella sp. PE311 TaxID=3366943 RepID=UPI003980CEC2
MKITQQIANNLHQVYFGGNWTASNFKDSLSDVSLKMATHKVGNLNSILALTFHIHYYLKGAMDGLKTNDLTIKDKFSFNHPILNTDSEWLELQNTIWEEAKAFISIIEDLEESCLDTFFIDEKYGSYYRNLAGIIEHTHYHLGQIVTIKKIISST